ncbi:hypothetical protein Tco_0014028 [Tanacetum coccineum]
MMKRVDNFIKSEEVYRSTELLRGEFLEKGQGAPSRKSRSPHAVYGGGKQRTDKYNNFNNRRDHCQPYVPSRANNRRYENQRHEYNHLSLDALTKWPKEILATELQLQLPSCPSMLKTSLESKKLSHLVKDVKQTGNAKGRQQGNNNGKGMVINMAWTQSNNRKRKSRVGDEEDWINIPITFPPILADDVSDEPLIVEAEIEVFLTELVGFSGEQLIPIGKIKLDVAFGNEGLCRRTMMKFTVVGAFSAYNIILGRTRMRSLRAVSSTIHAMMKFPTPRGITTLVARTATVSNVGARGEIQRSKT